MRCIPVLLAAVAAAVLASPAGAATTWLCKPGMARDACTPGLKTTTFSPDGKRQGTQSPKPGARKVDCFYVYPTVSDQQRDIATKAIDPEIRSIALYQAARYSQECRVFAPVYRQRTIRGISGAVSGETTGPRRNVVDDKGYADVRGAWREYLKKHNKGRGVVLVGHSQGTFVLRRLIAREIDRKPAVRRKLVSALLLGGNVEVREGQDAGGDFRNIKACRSGTQLGCVVAFSVFDEAPPADALFGRTTAKGREVLCTNPAKLAGGAAPVDAVFPSEPFAPGTLIAAGIGLMGVTQPTASTPWVALPDAYTAECRSEGGASYLHIAPRGGAPDFKPSPTPGWGLHLVDANIALGDLVALVRKQARAFTRRAAEA